MAKHNEEISANIIASKLSPHSAGESFDAQVHRLRCSGFPDSILFDVAERLLTSQKRQRKSEKTRRPAIVPYIHCLAHNLKRVASKYDVQVALSAPDKLKKLCPRINNKKEENVQCQTRHQHKYVDCKSHVVYEVPFSCGKVYVGQSGRRINVRLREHDLSLKASPSGHLTVHVRDCHCTPLFNQTKVLKHLNDKRAREIYEAYKIKKEESKCVSAPSVFLSEKELRYLDTCP